MNLLLGSLTIGLILSLLAWGVYISFRIFSFPDMTADGSIVLGAAVAARLLTAGMAPLPATLLAALAGLLAGMATGILQRLGGKGPDQQGQGRAGGRLQVFQRRVHTGFTFYLNP